MTVAAPLLARTHALHDLTKLLSKQAEELQHDIRAAIWLDEKRILRNSEIDNAASDFSSAPMRLRQAVECMEKALVSLDCADVLSQMPDADEAETEAALAARTRERVA